MIIYANNTDTYMLLDKDDNPVCKVDQRTVDGLLKCGWFESTIESGRERFVVTDLGRHVANGS
jgi:hypothetical protein